MTRDAVARTIVHAALRIAGAPLTPPSAEHVQALPDAWLVSQAIPDYDGPGRARFLYGLSHAAKGLELKEPLARLRDGSVGEVIHAVAALLPVRLFQCSDTLETHFYEQRGSGKCRIDDTDLVEIFL